MRASSFLLASLLALPVTGSRAEDGSAEACQRGIKLAKQDKHDEALIELDKAIRLDPNNVRAFMERGRIYMLFKGEPKKAVADFTAVIARDAKDIDAFNERFVAHWLASDPENALLDLKVLLKHHRQQQKIHPEKLQHHQKHLKELETLGAQLRAWVKRGPEFEDRDKEWLRLQKEQKEWKKELKKHEDQERLRRLEQLRRWRHVAEIPSYLAVPVHLEEGSQLDAVRRPSGRFGFHGPWQHIFHESFPPRPIERPLHQRRRQVPESIDRGMLFDGLQRGPGWR